MLTVRWIPAILLVQALLLLVLGLLLGWGPVGWVAAWGSLLVLDSAAARLVRRSGARVLGPADLVTALRSTLACALTGLVAQELLSRPDLPGRSTSTVVVLASIALSLDLVDGWVARATATTSPLGARIDGEADAYLMLVLSVWVAPVVAWWALAIGLARYVFGAAGWFQPWLRAPLPFRYWRKVVTACAGIALVVAAADVLPAPAPEVLLGSVLLLLAESFGRDVWWLWRHRSGARVARAARRVWPR